VALEIRLEPILRLSVQESRSTACGDLDGVLGRVTALDRGARVVRAMGSEQPSRSDPPIFVGLERDVTTRDKLVATPVLTGSACAEPCPRSGPSRSRLGVFPVRL
jgi:hypothetical protein